MKNTLLRISVLGFFIWNFNDTLKIDVINSNDRLVEIALDAWVFPEKLDRCKKMLNFFLRKTGAKFGAW